VDWIKCIPGRLLRAVRREAGFTLIEVVFAIAIFGIVATALIGVLSSATVSDGLSRQRSIALELAQQQVEYIRQLNYIDAGISGGNPGGVVQQTQTKKVTGLWYVLTTRIRYVNDPVPASYVASANYKQVRVTVARQSDGKQLAKVTTYLASPTRAYSGGLNNGVINVTTQDFWTLALLGNVQIHLTKTWDASFDAGDVTDSETGMPTFGQVTFEGLEETPAGANPGYYDVTAALTGYYTLPEDQPPADTAPASAAHLALARNGTTNTTIRLYKGCQITVHVIDGSNPPNLYTGGQATVTISTQRGGQGLISQQFQTTTGIVTTSTLDGYPVVPGSNYEVDVDTTSPQLRHGQLTGLTVPDDYSVPNPSSTFDVTLAAYVPPQLANVTVTVRRYSCPSGSTRSGATVKIVWLPNQSDPTHNFTGTTNYNGQVVFTGVPFETYDIRASRFGQSGSLTDQTISGDVSLCVAIS
jgi:prepilin-type N-terminal cleavage/methylation domain-containing protein